MHPFVQTISIIGPIVLAIIALTLFFKFIGWVSRLSSRHSKQLSVDRILNENTNTTLHLMNGVKLENVMMVGFTPSWSSKGNYPHEFNGMVILKHEDGHRTMVQAKMIRLIEVPPESNRAPTG